VQFEKSVINIDELGNTTTTLPSGEQVSGNIIYIPVTRTGTQGTALVDYNVTSNQAIENEDYLVIPTALMWADGDQSPRQIPLFIIHDEIAENTEVVRLEITSPQGATLGKISQTEVKISDPPQVTVTPKLCEGETTYAIQPVAQTHTLTIGEAPITLNFVGGEGEVNIIEVPDAAIVTLGLSAVESDPKIMQLTLTPRQVGETQLRLGDKCNNQALVNITVESAPQPAPDEKCQADAAQFIQPSTQTITMAVDEKEPLPVIFTQVQGDVELIEAPDGSIVTLDLPIFVEEQLAQLKLTPRKVGQTQLILQDCTGKQAEIAITVTEPAEVCTAKPFQSQPPFTLQMGDQPLKLSLISGQQAELIQAPEPTIITLEVSEPNLSWLKLTPRQPGHTELTLKNCTGEMTTHITVLNPGSLGGICQLAEKTDGICENPTIKQALPASAFAFNANGDFIEVNATILGQLDSPICDTQAADEVSDETAVEEEIQESEETEMGTGDDVGGEMDIGEIGDTQVSHNNPFCQNYQESGGNCDDLNGDIRRKLTASSTACAIGEDLVLGEDKPITLTLALIADESHRGLPAHRFLFVERETNDQHHDYLMYDGDNWQSVTKLDLNQLITVESYGALPAIVESTHEFSLSKFPESERFGTFTVHFGYQLENGTLVFNNSEYQPIQFTGANSITYPPTAQEADAYFKNGLQTTSRLRTEENGETSETIAITSTLKPAREHLGQIADIIMVATYTPTGEEPMNYIRDSNNQWFDLKWNGEAKNLIAAENNETLTNNMTFEIFQGELPQETSDLAIYIGYRLTDNTDNTIIFNGKEPLMLTMP